MKRFMLNVVAALTLATCENTEPAPAREHVMELPKGSVILRFKFHWKEGDLCVPGPCEQPQEPKQEI